MKDQRSLNKVKVEDLNKKYYNLFESSSESERMDEPPEVMVSTKHRSQSVIVQSNPNENNLQVKQTRSFSNISKSPKVNTSVERENNENKIKIEDFDNTPQIIVDDVDVKTAMRATGKRK